VHEAPQGANEVGERGCDHWCRRAEGAGREPGEPLRGCATADTTGGSPLTPIRLWYLDTQRALVHTQRYSNRPIIRLSHSVPVSSSANPTSLVFITPTQGLERRVSSPDQPLHKRLSPASWALGSLDLVILHQAAFLPLGGWVSPCWKVFIGQKYWPPWPSNVIVGLCAVTLWAIFPRPVFLTDTV